MEGYLSSCPNKNIVKMLNIKYLDIILKKSIIFATKQEV